MFFFLVFFNSFQLCFSRPFLFASPPPSFSSSPSPLLHCLLCFLSFFLFLAPNSLSNIFNKQTAPSLYFVAIYVLFIARNKVLKALAGNTSPLPHPPSPLPSVSSSLSSLTRPFCCLLWPLSCPLLAWAFK